MIKLKELLNNVNEENLYPETDWGYDVGKEIITEILDDEMRKGLLETNKKLAKKNNWEFHGDFILLYHGSSEANIKKINKSGKFKTGTWFATDFETAERYARAKVSIRQKHIVTTVRVYMGSIVYNGYFSSQEDLYFGNSVYYPKGLKKFNL